MSFFLSDGLNNVPKPDIDKIVKIQKKEKNMV